jgi:hypothetical protein
MPADPQAIAALAAQMKTLGLPDPEGAARRELETGSPILATQSFLTWLTNEMVAPGDRAWIDRALSNREHHPVLAPLLDRLLAAGASRDDLTLLARLMQFRICDHVCYMVDSVALPGYVPIQDFGLYVVGGGDSPTSDKPIVRLDALHEQIGFWDPSEEHDDDEEED